MFGKTLVIVGWTALLVIVLLTNLSCTPKNTNSVRSRQQILVEADRELADRHQALMIMKQDCQVSCQAADCPCQAEIMKAEKQIIELTLLYANAWNNEYPEITDYSLHYYWDPQAERSRRDLKEFIYTLADPDLANRQNLTVILLSKGDWENLLPVLTDIFYELQAEIPDLKQFLQLIHFGMLTEKCGVKMPADEDLPFIVFFQWADSQQNIVYSSPVFFDGIKLPWVRNTGITRNSISALILAANER